MFDDGVEASDIPYEHLQGDHRRICTGYPPAVTKENVQGEQSLPYLLIGNVITSAIKKHPTMFQIALGVYFNKKKKVKHMHDYLVCCSCDELLRFKKSSAVAKYLQICNDRRQPVTVERHVQVIVDNFDSELSSPIVLVSTHDMATIKTHSKLQ